MHFDLEEAGNGIKEEPGYLCYDSSYTYIAVA